MTRHYSRLHKEQDRRSEARNVQPRTLNSPSPLRRTPCTRYPSVTGHTHTPHTQTHTWSHIAYAILALGLRVRARQGQAFCESGQSCDCDADCAARRVNALAEKFKAEQISRWLLFLSLALSAAAPICTAGVDIIALRLYLF